jgi:hypothetical protein
MASSFPAEVAQRIDQGSDVQPYTPSQESGETMVPGELVFYDTTNNWMERCGADPALIAGISEGSSEAGRVLTEDGKVPIRLLKSGAVVRFASTTTPAESHAGDEYGITRDANGHWLLDIAKTTTDARFQVVRVDIPSGSFYCIPLAEYLQFDGVDS